MTKPIEGWIFCDSNDEPLAMIGMVGGNIRQRFSVAKELVEGDTKERYRPVRITFTDEYEAVTKYKRLDPVRNDQYDKQVEEALREYKERIWEMVKTIEDKYYKNPGPIEEDFMLHWTTYGDIKRVIFGEEK